MKVCFVSPPTVTDFEDRSVAEADAIRMIAEHAPLGVLSLAAILEQCGHDPQIVDLNQWYYAFLREEDPAIARSEFAPYVCERLRTLDFDVLGFSTICSSYPLTLRIASALKRERPDTPIVIGGPQASVVDEHTLKAFPGIDFVVRGEAEQSLPQLLQSIEGTGHFDSIKGITFRRDGVVRRTPNAPVIEDLDTLPFPAFHLFPTLKSCHYAPLELGRGCPFACTFCSTNDFFRRNFRLKSPQTIIEQMRTVQRTYGISTFDLVHDMFTVDRKRVVKFCEALLASGETFYWNCSARTDCIDEELVELMAEAGCRGIFFGIETGSQRLQHTILKRLDLEEARRMIACTDRVGIQTAVSLITGFPEETIEDVRDSVDFILDSMRFDNAAPQFHLLAPLVETPLFSQHRHELIFDDIISDMSHQGWRQAAADRELIAAHPDIFGNFYSVPTPHLARKYLKELREFLLNGSIRFRWLFVALHQERTHLVDVFEAWREWRNQHRTESDISVERLNRYYGDVSFADDFLTFLGDWATTLKPSLSPSLRALIQYELGVSKAVTTSSSSSRPPSPALALQESSASAPIDQGQLQPFEPATIPMLVPDLLVLHLEADYTKIVDLLRRKRKLKGIRRRPVVVAIRPSDVGDERAVVQLSSTSGKLLELCDGERSIREIASSVNLTHEFGDIPVDKACWFGFEMLRQQGLVAARPPTSARLPPG